MSSSIDLALKGNFLSIQLSGLPRVYVRRDMINSILDRTRTGDIDLCGNNFIKMFSADLSFGINFAILYTRPLATDDPEITGITDITGTWRWFNVPESILTAVMKGSPRRITFKEEGVK